MQQTLTETVDASATAIIQRNFALTGGLTADQLAIFLTLVSTNDGVENDLLELSASLKGFDGGDTLTTVINLENYNMWDNRASNETITSSIDGGTGDDTISGTINLGPYWGHIRNIAKGGDGNDSIFLNVQCSAGWDDNMGGNLVELVADGGAGNDIIELRTNTQRVARSMATNR